MVDKMSLQARVKLNITQYEPGVFIWKDLKLYTYIRKGEFKYLEGELQNLRITYIGDILTVSNSLHYFANGNNYSDFTFERLSIAILQLSAFFELKPSDFRILRLEFGLNLTVHKIVSDHWQNLSGYKFKEKSPMKKRGFTYGVKLDLTEFALKIYNKSQEYWIHYLLKIQKNVCRVEMEFKKMRLIPFINTLADLLVLDNIKLLHHKLIEKIRRIEYNPSFHFLKKLSSNDRRFVYAGLQADFWRNEQKLNSNTFKKNRTAFLRLIKQDKPLFDLADELNLKFASLI